MPKGVEHRDFTEQWYAPRYVDHPLMPKGVEHEQLLDTRKLVAIVDHPLMPKGVEHSGGQSLCRQPAKWIIR